MSESEKKRRGLYRKNREKWIFAQSVIVAVLTIAVLISALVSHQLRKEYYIGYNERGSIDYDVYLKENDFYDKPYLEKNQSYVASLIDRIITNFNYEIDMDTEGVNYRYSYTITAKLEILDNTSDVAIFNPEYELVSVQNRAQNSSSRLTINEIVVLNYDEYNDLANRFLKAYALTNTTSSIVVTLNVDVLSDCSAFSGSSADTYSSELRIPLTTKTVNIKMLSAVPAAQTKMIACTRGAGGEVFKTTAIVLAVVDTLMILLLVAFIYLTRTADITYAARVKKIVSQYKSYIQRIKNLFDSHGYQVVAVDTFDELLEIRDTIQAPILMYENEEKTCAKFMIPTDSKLLYLYEIKVEGYVDPEPEHPQDPTPTTIVKPNITNVVRPVVKVVVKPQEPKRAPETEADVETIVEDAEIEIDADEDELPEVIATVEEELDTDEDDFDEDDADDDEAEAVADAVVTMADAEEIVETEEDTEADGEQEMALRYKRSFQSRLIQADTKVKEFYAAIRNKLLSYKGVKARTSWSFESFNKQRIQCAKLNIRGKTLLVYLNLSTEQYSVSKYHFRNVGDKQKFADVPMLLRVKSDRGLKYALELIEEMMSVLQIPEGEVQSVAYDIPYQTTEELIKAGLIKVLLPNGAVLDQEAYFAMAGSEIVEEVDPEVQSILESIPTSDEESDEDGVDAIDVWMGSGITDSYDPDGNTVEEGDIVLVPTRNEADDKDIVCEAEVARGNYKVDPATLDRPLKKMIGVVRRKAEQIFTAMITPVDEKEDQ